jgi:hypothetical protein
MPKGIYPGRGEKGGDALWTFAIELIPVLPVRIRTGLNSYAMGYKRKKALAIYSMTRAI